ncbi:MAG: BON domain-containing protein [Proteobacteria bacterium]|nr:BON domain-containing protein [Pseudomonadota bacterium]MBU4469929.1 BON domain-containing protein [Pseudomonadota bacterium]MCG2753691.1 BON domain-containing protein [Desulfobacteraceae bacterium]
MKHLIMGLAMAVMVFSAGCVPLIVGAGAAGGYKVVTEERTGATQWEDSNISASIKTEFVKDPLIKSLKIDVDTIDGHVILSGVVDSELQSSRAVEIAEQYKGVKSVKNNMQIGSKSFGQAIDDKVIGGKIKAKLINEPGISALNIDVDVDIGRVTLSGVVHSQKIKNRIMELAREVQGVVDVVDNIRLTE